MSNIPPLTLPLNDVVWMRVEAVDERPKFIKRYEKWKDIIEISGPAGLRLIRGFNDEPLRGDWKGHRSSRLGEQFRVIYRIEKKELFVLVIDLTAHDYRRK
jgi:addiction module RelE/StbE family toxin